MYYVLRNHKWLSLKDCDISQDDRIGDMTVCRALTNNFTLDSIAKGRSKRFVRLSFDYL